MNTRQKGNYYQRKTAEFFRKEGYAVYPMEVARSIFTPKGVIYQKNDIAGCDLLAMNGEEILFIQCKTNPADVSSAIKEFHQHPYPPDATRLVILWKPRAKEPTIHNA